MRLLPQTEVQAEQLGIKPVYAGFKIPYFDLRGKPLDFYRYRFLQAQPSRGFASLTEAPTKPQKYTQPAGTAPEVYLCPLLTGTTWAKVAADPATPVIITEGELKAACGCMHDLPVIGLGGVWNFQSGRLGQMLLPVLEAFKWEGRSVYVCYDSDTNDRTKTDVQQAQARLARILVARGAKVLKIALPELGGNKVGMDDFIAARGMAEFIKLIDVAEEVKQSAHIHQMNEEVAYIHQSQEVIELATGIIMTPEKFANAAYRPRKYVEQTQQGQRVHYVAKEWLECEYRHEVTALDYTPGQPQITEDGAYNLWKPSTVVATYGSITPWERVFEHLMRGAGPVESMWLRRWLAYPLRHPGAKLRTAVLLWGPQGTGKSMLGMTMKRLYGSNFHKATDEELFGRWGYWAHGHCFILIDEIEAKTKFEVSDKLKNMITRDDVTIELKMQKPYTVPDRLNLFFTSNRENAIQIDPDDRRFFVHQVRGAELTHEEFTAYLHWLDEEGGAAHLLDYFLNRLDMGDFDPAARPPYTAARAELVENSLSEIEQVCFDLARDRALVLDQNQAACHLWTVKDLLKRLDPEVRHRHWTPTLLARSLRKAGIKKVASGANNVLVDGARQYVWAVCKERECELLTATQASNKYAAEHDAANPGKKFEASRAVAKSGRVQ